MARQKLNREPLEQKIIEYIQKDRHPLEIFADRDYYLAGADETWNEAYKRINNMPNYELVGIYNNIIAEENGESFDSYYDVFRLDYLETERNYKITQTFIKTVDVKAKSKDEAIKNAQRKLLNAKLVEEDIYAECK